MFLKRDKHDDVRTAVIGIITEKLTAVIGIITEKLTPFIGSTKSNMTTILLSVTCLFPFEGFRFELCSDDI